MSNIFDYTVLCGSLYMVKDMEIYYVNNILYVELAGVLKVEDKEYLKKRIGAIIKEYEVKQIIFENNNSFLCNRHFLREIKHMYENRLSIR